MNKLFILFLLVIFFISCSQKKEKITELSQLKDKRICVLTGSAGDIAAREVFPNAEIVDLVAAADAAYNIKIGKIDAFIFNKSVLKNIVKVNPELKILDQPVSQVEVAAAFNKERKDLLAEVNSALDKMESDGTLELMRKKWIISEYQVVPDLPEIYESNQTGNIIMGTCAEAEPYSFYYQNKLTGFDIELAKKIGVILGKQIEIVDMTFESLIPALRSGKIDLAIGNFNVTEERKQFIAYSKPYVVNDINALVKK